MDNEKEGANRGRECVRAKEHATVGFSSYVSVLQSESTSHALFRALRKFRHISHVLCELNGKQCHPNTESVSVRLIFYALTAIIYLNIRDKFK